MQFRRAVQRYGRTPEPITPYQRAAQVWDERIGSARVQARNWRLMAFGGLALSAALSGGLLWQSLQSRVVPYVVEVDRLGEPARSRRPNRTTGRPIRRSPGSSAASLRDVRSVSLDPVLMRQNWLSAYDFATGRGARFLGDYARHADPFGEVGTRTVSVQVTSVVRASDRSSRSNGSRRGSSAAASSGRTHWTAILSVVVQAARARRRAAQETRSGSMSMRSTGARSSSRRRRRRRRSPPRGRTGLAATCRSARRSIPARPRRQLPTSERNSL